MPRYRRRLTGVAAATTAVALLILLASILGQSDRAATSRSGPTAHARLVTSRSPTEHVPEGARRTVSRARRAGSPQPGSAGPASGRAAFAPGVVLVGFRPGTSPATARRVALGVGGRDLRVIGAGTHVLELERSGVSAAVTELKRQPSVRYAEPDYRSQASGVQIPNDPSFPLQWASLNTGQLIQGVAGTAGADDRAAAAWAVSTGTRSVVIGEVDTGVDYNHPDVAANVWSNPGGIGGCAAGTHGYNVVAGTCDPIDNDTVYGGHGTHVAGIMGAIGNNGIGVAGVNWATTILPVKWLDANQSGTTSQLISALDWLVKAKQAGVNVRIANDSATFLGTAFSQALSDEIDLLGTNNILFVTAAGNTGQDDDNPSFTRYPCGYSRPNEICVTASNQQDQLPSWANYGATKVDLAAPGDQIYSTLRNGTYGYISGGSMAAAQVSGAAALVLSGTDMTATALKSDIVNNVDPLPALAGKVRSGGRLDICQAIAACGQPVITSLGPGSGATGVSTGADVFAVFSAPMDHASTAGAFSLVRTSDNSPVAGSVIFFGETLPIFVPSTRLASGTQYTASFSTAAMSKTGGHLSAVKTWSFTTVNPPTVGFTQPASGASGVYPNAPLIATFSSPMNEASVQAAFSMTPSAGGGAVGGSFAWFGPTVMVFTPSGDLGSGTQYTASLSTGAQDQNGNGLSTVKSWSFTTTSSPVIEQLGPKAGATGVGTRTSAYVVFSEAMDHASTAAAFTLRRTSDNSPVAGSVVWFGDRLPLFIPAAALSPNMAYTASIAGGAMDQSGHAVANPTSWQFTTGAAAGSKIAQRALRRALAGTR